MSHILDNFNLQTQIAVRRATTAPVRLPCAAATCAALEQCIEEAQRAFDLTDRADKPERTFWKAQRNAYVNAAADRAAGRCATAAGRAFVVESSRTPGKFYRLSLLDGLWRCSCEAGDEGRYCRHAAQVTAIEIADALEAQDAIDLLPFEPSDAEIAGLIAEPERYGTDDLTDLFVF